MWAGLYIVAPGLSQYSVSVSLDLAESRCAGLYIVAPGLSQYSVSVLLDLAESRCAGLYMVAPGLSQAGPGHSPPRPGATCLQWEGRSNFDTPAPEYNTHTGHNIKPRGIMSFRRMKSHQGSRF